MISFQGCGIRDIESLLREHEDFMSRELTLMLRRMRRRRWAGLPVLLRVVLRLRNVGGGAQPGRNSCKGVRPCAVLESLFKTPPPPARQPPLGWEWRCEVHSARKFTRLAKLSH